MAFVGEFLQDDPYCWKAWVVACHTCSVYLFVSLMKWNLPFTLKWISNQSIKSRNNSILNTFTVFVSIHISRVSKWLGAKSTSEFALAILQEERTVDREINLCMNKYPYMTFQMGLDTMHLYNSNCTSKHTVVILLVHKLQLVNMVSLPLYELWKGIFCIPHTHNIVSYIECQLP